MDLNLQIQSQADDSLLASYVCPCGCNPSLAYAMGAEHSVDTCCCGNTFVVGPRAGSQVPPREGFELRIDAFQAPWNAQLQAAWAIGPSTHADDHDHDKVGAHDPQHDPAGSHEAVASGTAVDPVCGMTVTIATATEKDLHLVHEGVDYYFCGKGCRLEFGDDPARFLDPAYVPSM